MKQNRGFAITASAAAGIAALVIAAAAASAGSDCRSQVVAVIDGHAITQQELDTTIAVRLYQLRRQALDQLINDYLLEQAARRAHLTIPEYLDKEITVTVSDADARAQYDKYKGQIKVPFDEIKPRLIAALAGQRQAQNETALRAKLRSDAHVELNLDAPRLEVAIGDSPTEGPTKASVTIIEFGDYQSPFSKMEVAALQEVREKYGEKVRVVFKDFPALNSKEAVEAAKAARCANEQGKFWQFHDLLCDDPSKLALPDLKAIARQVGLDSTKFDSCLDSGKYTSAIEKDIEEGLRIGFRSAPSFLVNGLQHQSAQSAAGFQTMIDPELKDKGRVETKSH